MTDYTPTTDEVRQAYIWDEDDAAEFDRWLAVHDKEVLDKAAERLSVECNAAMDLDYPFRDLGMTSTARNRLAAAIAAIHGEGEQA
jgi:hypothetical protein